jgi:hypothetical protein
MGSFVNYWGSGKKHHRYHSRFSRNEIFKPVMRRGAQQADYICGDRTRFHLFWPYVLFVCLHHGVILGAFNEPLVGMIGDVLN